MGEEHSAPEAPPFASSPEPHMADNTVRIPPRERTLDERFEDGRQDNLRSRWPILSGNVCHRRRTMIDDVAPEELPEAADAILLTHAARMTIRAVAKVEEAWATFDGNDPDLAAAPQSVVMAVLLEERDKAAEFYHKVREKQARVQHLESICDRGKTLSFPKPRLPRAKLKKVTAG